MFSLRRLAARLPVIVPLAALFVVACEHSPSAPGVPATITVTRNPATLAVTTTEQFIAIAKDANGNVVGVTPTWSAGAGGAISSSGLFTAGVAVGTFDNTVTATVGSLSGSATVTVIGGPLASITIAPSPTTVAVNGTQQFTAVGKDAGGNTVALTPVWSAVSGGSISSTGLFTAGTVPGTFTNTVMATSGGISAHATVTVGPGPLTGITVSPNPSLLDAGATQQFTAAGRDSLGNSIAITPTWSVVAGGGEVNQAGLFTAGTKSGTFDNTVQASFEGRTGTATVTVRAGSVASITVTPNPTTLGVGLTRRFTAVANDANGNVVTITPTWSVVADGGEIDSSGLFTAGSTPGTYPNTVQAAANGMTGTATVIVTSGTLASITVSPNPATMGFGGTQQFTAVGKDAGGNILVITPTWDIVAGGGEIVDTTGFFTADSVAGTYTNTVRASADGVTGSATVNVTSGALATITVTPDPVSMETNGTQQFIAVGRDGSGSEFVITPTWSVVNPASGTINSTGFFTAGTTAGTYTKTVVATSGLIADSATVMVTAVAPPPSPPSVNLGTAAGNGIMAGTQVTCVSNGLISADVSVSPGSTVTGFPPCVITGTQNLANAVAAQAQVDLTAAYNTLAGMPCSPSNAIVADLGGTTKPAGVYCSATGIGVTGTLTLNGGGDPNATFVFQAGSALTTAGNIVLINGAQAKNVYWQVGSSATLGTGSQWQGSILALSSITLVDTATLLGRALARNGAVSLGTSNTITLPPL